MTLFRRTAGPRAGWPAVCPVRRPAALALLVAALLAGGCASPGPPRAPSLQLPQPVTDLSARRMGNVVELTFTAPWRSTDKLPLRAATINGVLCRAVGRQPCMAVAGFSPTAVATAGPQGGRNLVTWRDPLPAGLVSGERRLLSYRVEFFNQRGRSAGQSEAAYTAAGPSPAAVQNLRADGSRLGIVLSWQAAPLAQGTVLLERENLAAGEASAATPRSQAAGAAARAKPAKAAKGAAAPLIWLEAHTAEATASSSNPMAETLDTTAEPDVAYRYTAVRRLELSLGGRAIELRSAASRPVEFTLHEIYPPPAPTGLTAAGYFTAGEPAQPASPGFAVDLIWQPVDGAGLLAGLAGYNVYRATLSGHQAGAEGTAPSAKRERLNSSPVTLPAFRDSTADPADAYRYFVTAVDDKGNESSAATTVLQSSQTLQSPL